MSSLWKERESRLRNATCNVATPERLSRHGRSRLVRGPLGFRGPQTRRQDSRSSSGNVGPGRGRLSEWSGDVHRVRVEGDGGSVRPGARARCRRRRTTAGCGFADAAACLRAETTAPRSLVAATKAALSEVTRRALPTLGITRPLDCGEGRGKDVAPCGERARGGSPDALVACCPESSSRAAAQRQRTYGETRARTMPPLLIGRRCHRSAERRRPALLAYPLWRRRDRRGRAGHVRAATRQGAHRSRAGAAARTGRGGAWDCSPSSHLLAAAAHLLVLWVAGSLRPCSRSLCSSRYRLDEPDCAPYFM